MMINKIAILIPQKNISNIFKWYKTMTWTYLSLLPSSVDHNLWKLSTWFNPQILIRLTSTTMAAMAFPGLPNPLDPPRPWRCRAVAPPPGAPVLLRCATGRCRSDPCGVGKSGDRGPTEDLGRSKNVEIWGHGEYGDPRINPWFGVNMKDGNLDEQEWDIDSWLMIRKLLRNSMGFMLMTLTC